MKRLLVGLVLLGGALPLGAMNHNLAWPWGNPARCSNPQTPLFAFYNRVNTTMMFDSGDEIEIYCQAAVRTGSGLTWTLSRNQVRQAFLSGEAEDLPANLFVIRIPTKDLTPGFYDLRVKLEGLGSAKLDLFPRKGRNGEVAVQSVPPTGICTFGWKADEMPVTDYRPADFVEFWRKAYADYRAKVPLDARVESAETTFDAKAVEQYNVTNACLPQCFDPKGVKYDEVVSYKVSWAGPDGGRVTAWLARPKAPGRYPALLVLPGAGYNPRPRPLDHARHGYVAIDVHVHGRDCENPDRSRPQGVRENGEPIRFPLEEVGWYNVYLRAARGVDYLASLPFVDPGRIATVGGSQGGRLSIVVPALEPRVAATVPSIAHGGNVPYLEWFERMNGNVFKEGRPKFWGYYPDPSLVRGDGRDLVGAPPVAEGEMMRSEAYFDTMHFAPEVKCPVLMSMGLIDYISFPSAVYATYLKCGSPDKTMVPVAGHGHDWFAAFDRRAYRWLEEKLPPPKPAPEGLTVEYRVEPVGLDTTAPRFGWHLPAGTARQCAYELEIDGVSRGWTEGDANFGVTCPDLKLATSQRVSWRVRIRDDRGRVSPWSGLATFTMGVLGDWEAAWIGPHPSTRPDADLGDAQWITAPVGSNGCVSLTASLDLGEADLVPALELIHLSRARAEIRINGRLFSRCEGHVRDWRYAAFRNATPYLAVGRNVVEVKLLAERDEPAAPRAFLARLVKANGTAFETSAGTWRSPDGAVTALGRLRETDFGRQAIVRTETQAPAFARRFTVKKPLRAAVLHVTGVGFYEAELNGAKIGRKVLDPSPTAFDKRVLYSTYRLDGLVRKGENELRLLVGHGWYDPRSVAVWNFEMAPWRDFPRAIARLDLAYLDGTTERLVTDDSWDQVANPVAYDDVYEGEVDDPAGTKAAAKGLKAVVCEGPRGRLVAEQQPGAEVVRTIAPSRIDRVGEGAYLIQFPEDLAGWMRLTVRGQEKGDVLSFRYDERVSPGPQPAQDSARDGLHDQHPEKPLEARNIDHHFRYTGSHRVLATDAAFQTDRYVCTGRPVETYEPRFTYKGFRAVLVKGLAHEPRPEDAVACVVRTAFPVIGSFETSDGTFNTLMAMGARSYMSNFADGVPTDCPHREKNGWTGDASIASELAQYLVENTAGYEKWLNDVCDAQAADGSLPGIVPTSGWGFAWGNGPAWDSALPVVAWNLYLYRGDRRACDAIYRPLLAYLAYTATRADANGLVKHGLGDWVPVNAKHRPTGEYVSSCYYLQALRIAAEIAALRGEADERARLEALAGKTRAGLRAKYAKGGGVFDNGEQSAQALALAFGLAEDAERADAEARLVAAVERAGVHVDTGILGAKQIFRVLSRMGRTDLAWRMIVNPTSPSMVDWIRKGGTALWEEWGDSSSRNHVMFGDFIGWAYQYLAGLRLAEKPGSTSAVTLAEGPGFGSVVIEPVILPELDHLAASTETPYGTLAVSWRRTDCVRVTVTVPPGVKAEVRLPGRPATVQAPGTTTYSVRESPADDPVYDLVICGSSSAGLAAAVEAKRHGLKAVVLSETARIGGLTTGGLGQTDIGLKDAFGGISREFYRAVKAHYADSANWKWQRPEDYKPGGQSVYTSQEDAMWTFEPSAALKILEGWEKRDGLDIRRGERLDRGPGGVVKEGGRIVAIRGESGKVYRGRFFVDATYEGDLLAAAGCAYAVGREDNAVYGECVSGIQRRGAVSHQFPRGIDPYVVKGDPSSGLLPGVEKDDPRPDGSGDRRVQAYCFRMCLTDVEANRIPFKKPAGYDEREYELLFRWLESSPTVMPQLPSGSPMPNRKTDTNNGKAFSSDYIGQNYAWPEASYAERDEIAARHLRYQQGLMWTCANHPRVPERVRAVFSRWGTCRDEFPGERGDGWQNQLYVREGRRLVGETVMTEAECRMLRRVPRPVAKGAYSMDSHHVRRYVTERGDVQNEGDIQDWRVERPYDIDYGAIVPKRAECRNLFVPVCLSASHMAYGSIRMEPVFFALGHASAAAAAVAIADGSDAQDVDYGKLAAILKAEGQVFGSGLKLPMYFTDHMVLPRDRPVPVWGTDAPGTAVTVAFADAVLRTWADENGRWRAELPALPASAQGRAFTVCGTTTVTLEDVVVGDVVFVTGPEALGGVAKQPGRYPAFPEGYRLDGRAPRIASVFYDSYFRPNSRPEMHPWRVAETEPADGVPLGVLDATWPCVNFADSTPAEGRTAPEYNGMAHGFKDVPVTACAWSGPSTPGELAAIAAAWRRLWPAARTPGCETAELRFTPATPFAEILAAVAEARSRRPDVPLTVRLAEGRYPLDRTQVMGPEFSNVTWIGEGRGAELSGGEPVTGWRKSSDGCWEAPFPRVAEALYAEGLRATRSTWPATGFLPVKGVTCEALTNNAAAGGRERTRLVLSERDAAFLATLPEADLADVQLVVNYKWKSERRPLLAFDRATRTVVTEGPKTDPWARWEKKDLYRLENVRLPELAPGTYFCDAAAKRLRYRPYGAEPKDVLAPTAVETLVALSGDLTSAAPVTNVTFRNLVFAHTAPLAGAPTRPTVYGCQAASYVCTATVVADGVRDCRFEDCRFEHTGSYGLWFREGCQRAAAVRCDFTDLGAGGVRIGPHETRERPKGAVPYVMKGPRATSFCSVEDCLIRGGGRYHAAGVGVLLAMASDCRIVRNEISDLYYTGISVGWIWGYKGSVSQRNLVADNLIYRIGQGRLADMGGIYTLGTSFGTRVVGNVIHDVDSYSYGGWGLYPDEGSEGILFENNLVYDTKDASFHQHYGRDNVVRNNVFAFSRFGQIAVTRAEPHRSAVFERNLVYWPEGPLFDKYAATLKETAKLDWKGNFWWCAAGAPSFNGKTFAEWQAKGNDRTGGVIDPGFADPARRDFRLSADSPVVARGFRPFDASRAGRTVRRIDPSAVWDRKSLYRTPKVWRHPKEFDSEVTPIWLEGEPYRGRPTRCFAYYGVPAGASATNRVPAIVLVHGGLGTAYPEWVRLWVRRGYAAIAVDNCGTIPVHGSDGDWMTHDAAGPHRRTQLDDPAGPVNDQWVYHAVAASMLSHSFIRSLEAVDAANVGVTGISWGGFLTCVLAAADDRFAYAVPVYGCGFNAEPGALAAGKRNADVWQRLWDPCAYLPFAKCPLLWVDGTNDFAFSLDRVRRSAALAPVESQFCTRLRMVHGHGAPGEAPAEIAAFADFYAKGGPDVVRVTSAKVAGGAATVGFTATGRKVVRAELLWTADGPDVPWPKRAWRAEPVEGVDSAAGRLSVRLPAGARECVVNLISEDGLISSTPVLN